MESTRTLPIGRSLLVSWDTTPLPLGMNWQALVTKDEGEPERHLLYHCRVQGCCLYFLICGETQEPWFWGKSRIPDYFWKISSLLLCCRIFGIYHRLFTWQSILTSVWCSSWRNMKERIFCQSPRFPLLIIFLTRVMYPIPEHFVIMMSVVQEGIELPEDEEE